MKKRMGRPPKPEAESLAERLYVRVSKAEKESLESAAANSEMPLSAWIRKRLLDAAKRDNRH
jgi:predicted HicB family RNase H-like nuclease